MFILIASLPVLVFCLLRLLANQRAGEPWLNWLVVLVVWLNLLIFALRRRLVLDQHGLEYTDLFVTHRLPWSQVSRLSSRRVLGLWRVEGLDVWTASPELKEFFIDLSQFGSSWRGTEIGRRFLDEPHER
jgi:hypothetical protein